jgi:hypothetical protein
MEFQEFVFQKYPLLTKDGSNEELGRIERMFLQPCYICCSIQ